MDPIASLPLAPILQSLVRRYSLVALVQTRIDCCEIDIRTVANFSNGSFAFLDVNYHIWYCENIHSSAQLITTAAYFFTDLQIAHDRFLLFNTQDSFWCWDKCTETCSSMTIRFYKMACFHQKDAVLIHDGLSHIILKELPTLTTAFRFAYKMNVDDEIADICLNPSDRLLFIASTSDFNVIATDTYEIIYKVKMDVCLLLPFPTYTLCWIFNLGLYLLRYNEPTRLELVYQNEKWGIRCGMRGVWQNDAIFGKLNGSIMFITNGNEEKNVIVSPYAVEQIFMSENKLVFLSGGHLHHF